MADMETANQQLRSPARQGGEYVTVWDTAGSPIHADGDRFYHVDQFAVAFRQGEDEQEFELSSVIAPPHSSEGCGGCLLITPVNDAVAPRHLRRRVHVRSTTG